MLAAVTSLPQRPQLSTLHGPQPLVLKDSATTLQPGKNNGFLILKKGRVTSTKEWKHGLMAHSPPAVWSVQSEPVLQNDESEESGPQHFLKPCGIFLTENKTKGS